MLDVIPMLSGQEGVNLHISYFLHVVLCMVISVDVTDVQKSTYDSST
jgi:hypothetical protein